MQLVHCSFLAMYTLMDTLHYLGLLICFLIILRKIFFQNKNLPPSPPGLPIIGHFHLLKGNHLLKALLRVTNDAGGPIMLLRLGSRRVLAVSTPSSVEECLTKNDIIFANRPNFPSRKLLSYNYSSVGSSSYGQHWRNLRRVTAIQIFSSARMQMSSGVRAEEIRFMVKELLKGSAKKVEMSSFFYMLTFNIMMRLVAGYRYFGDDSLDLDRNGSKVDRVRKMFSSDSPIYAGDYFPFLKFLSLLNGERKRAMELLKKREVFIHDMIHINRTNSNQLSNNIERSQTIIDAILELQEAEPQVYTENMVKGIIMLMLIAGTHTTGMSMTSTVSHLILNPKILKKARDEIDANVPQTQLLDDANLSKLPYLHSIINESLRLGPVGSILPLHKSSSDCKIGGYDIPQDTMLFVNVYAIHRDPEVWDEPDTFNPERFQGIEGEMRMGGSNFMPFGLGRRKCPGLGLAMRLMALSLGTLIQCFDWEDCSKESMEKKLNVAQEHLVQVVFRPRKEMDIALSHL